jgi:hypothetical protein
MIACQQFVGVVGRKGKIAAASRELPLEEDVQIERRSSPSRRSAC